MVVTKNSLIRKLRLISKVMASQTGKQIIHILPNISSVEGNQTVKFGQLMKYITRNIFLKNNTGNVVGSLVPDSHIKNKNWPYLRIINLKCYQVCPSQCLPKYIKTLLLFTCFLRHKKRSGTSHSASFSVQFLEKKYFSHYFSHYVLLTL